MASEASLLSASSAQASGIFLIPVSLWTGAPSTPKFHRLTRSLPRLLTRLLPLRTVSLPLKQKIHDAFLLPGRWVECEGCNSCCMCDREAARPCPMDLWFYDLTSLPNCKVVFSLEWQWPCSLGDLGIVMGWRESLLLPTKDNHNLLLASLKRPCSWSLGEAPLLHDPWMQIGSHREEAGSSEPWQEMAWQGRNRAHWLSGFPLCWVVILPENAFFFFLLSRRHRDIPSHDLWAEIWNLTTYLLWIFTEIQVKKNLKPLMCVRND